MAPYSMNLAIGSTDRGVYCSERATYETSPQQLSPAESKITG